MSVLNQFSKVAGTSGQRPNAFGFQHDNELAALITTYPTSMLKYLGSAVMIYI
ncbi:hypothetical protein H0H93_016290 [Arthromyces matolae]|nr:hypothetical protein H0H93_016290 [Arthromyces matolae]